jgi:toxin CcdB
VVVPLIRVSVMGTPARHLNPEFEIGNVGVVMSTAELAGVPARLLGPKVDSLNARRDEIMAALDFLLTGF